MSSLPPAPESLYAPDHLALSTGAFEGSLPRVDWPTAGEFERRFRLKRWLWSGIATDDVFVSLAIVNLGYASQAFCYAVDLRNRKRIADGKAVAPPWNTKVAESMTTPGELAAFRCRTATARVVRTDAHLVVAVRGLGLDLDAELGFDAPPPIAAIVDRAGPDGSFKNATEKRALLPTTGELRVGDRTISLRDAFGGYDFTSGILARRTSWRWGFAMGRSADGVPVAFNLVDGFVGQPECALFVDKEVLPLPEAKITYDAGAPASPWSIEAADAAHLRFEPAFVYVDNSNFGVVRASFLQPGGVYSGELRAGDRWLRIERLSGVIEDQDVVW